MKCFVDICEFEATDDDALIAHLAEQHRERFGEAFGPQPYRCTTYGHCLEVYFDRPEMWCETCREKVSSDA